VEVLEEDEVVDGITTLVEMVLKTEMKFVTGKDHLIGLKMEISLRMRT
jgi:hypothetical protein